MRPIPLLAVLVALFTLSVGAGQAAARNDGSKPAPTDLAMTVTHVPVSTLNKVGAGQVLSSSAFGVFRLTGMPLMRGGLPELVTMNFAWCPHCAANSWALAVALSRFGKLSGLRLIDTGTLFGTKYHAHPSYPHTHGLSFFNAAFRGTFLNFGHVVVQDVFGFHLQDPTVDEANAINAFDPQGVLPAVDVGDWGFLGSGYSPGVLAGKTWRQIASALADPTNAIAKHVDGLANLFSAAICSATDGMPRGVCSSKGVVAAALARLH